MLGAMAIMIAFPFLALVPVAVFAVLFALSKSRIVLSAAILWLLYMVYEYGMNLRILCSGECNIRIDLLVLYPVLVLVSVIALLMFAIRVWQKSRG